MDKLFTQSLSRYSFPEKDKPNRQGFVKLPCHATLKDKIMLALDLIIAFILAYLCGSVSSAILVCKLLGLADPRTQGSQNPGATNVLRIGGKKAALLTLAGDFLKGFIPVLAAKIYGLDSWSLSLVALGAFLGHLYPLFFHFRGGKGVATFLGVSLALAWPLGLALILTWLSTALLFRYSSLGAIIMALCAPFYAGYFIDTNSAFVVGLISVLLLIRHRHNIEKLVAGTESKIGGVYKSSKDQRG
jgi:glycerol-3-phosphate acyltransferase PlsY